MKDPFPFEPLPWLSKATEPLADFLALPSLPLHIHEVLAAALLYSVVFWPISPIISTLAVGDKYSQLPRKRRINWDAHVVSMVQCIIINALSLWVILADEERAAMDAEGRIWGYTGACAMVQALAAGYFLWDLVTTSLHLDVFGPGTLAHAIAALIVYSFGFVSRYLSDFSISRDSPVAPSLMITQANRSLFRSAPSSTITLPSSSCGSSPLPSSTSTGFSISSA